MDNRDNYEIFQSETPNFERENDRDGGVKDGWASTEWGLNGLFLADFRKNRESYPRHARTGQGQVLNGGQKKPYTYQG
jgi:hypothetical protein